MFQNKRGGDVDQGFSRQAHQLAFSYLPGKILAAKPNIKDIKKGGLLNAKVVYPILQSFPERNRKFEMEVGKQLRDHLNFENGRYTFSFQELSSSISPQLEIYPGVFEIVLDDGRRIAYWISGTNTAFSGTTENLKAVYGKKIQKIFPTDIVFCDTKNANREIYPIHPLGMPVFANPKIPIQIIGDDNWKNRRLKIRLTDERDVDHKPLSRYPRTYDEYLQMEEMKGWMTAGKKARGRETYVSQAFPEVFYDIADTEKDISNYLTLWFEHEYNNFGNNAKKLGMSIESFFTAVKSLIENEEVDETTKEFMNLYLKKMELAETADSLKLKLSGFKNNIEFLRFLSIKKRLGDNTLKNAHQPEKPLPRWLAERGKIDIEDLTTLMKSKGIVSISPTDKIRVINFIYGWMSGSYDVGNTIFRIPVKSVPGEWPVLYYPYTSEGIFIEFDNDKLLKHFAYSEDPLNEKKHFLHTLSHMMIKTLPIYCGTDTSLLGERIYSGDKYSAILIFSKEPGEVKLGGMEDTLKRNLREWVKSWDSLIYCPLGGDDHDCCHFCSYIASGCVDFNHILSRNKVKEFFEKTQGDI